MLRKTFASLSLAGLAGCRKLLVCDHFDVGTTNNSSREHGGRLPQENVDRYRARLASLKMVGWASAIEIIELDHWHGFGLACRAALQLVLTPLVFVVQHDMAFKRSMAMEPLVRVLRQQITDTSEQQGAATETVNYICMLKTSTVNYCHRAHSRHKLDVGAPVPFRIGGTGGEDAEASVVHLIRLPQFFDCMHLARVDWYREF